MTWKVKVNDLHFQNHYRTATKPKGCKSKMQFMSKECPRKSESRAFWMHIINYMSYSWMLSSMPHSLIGRKRRQPNYPNKLAPKRGSQRSLMSTPTTPGEIIGQSLYCSRPGYSHMSDMNMIQSIMNRYLCKTRKMAKGELATRDLIIPTPKLPYVFYHPR